MSDLNKSRRRFFIATAAGLFGVSEGVIAWGGRVSQVSSSPSNVVPMGPEALEREMLSQRKKFDEQIRERYHNAISEIRKIGKPFSLPKVSTLRDSYFGGIWFSPDGKQLATVTGNITQQEIHVANVSAGTLSSSRLLTSFLTVVV